MRKLVLVVILALICTAIAVPKRPTVSVERRKQLAGAPSEFASHLLPNPIKEHMHSNGAMVMADLQKGLKAGTDEFSWSDSLPVDSNTLFTCSVFTNIPNLKVSFKAPSQRALVLGERLLRAEDIVQESSFGLGDADIPSTTYVFRNPEVGMWTIEVSASAMDALPHLSETKPEVILLLGNEAPFRVASFLQSYNLQLGETVGIDAMITDAKGVATPLLGVVEMADVDLIEPDGKEEVLQMRDDGLKADRVANDGVYAAAALLDEVGGYRARVGLRGRTAEGVEFLRTAQHFFEVVQPDLKLTGTATATQPSDTGAITFSLNVQWDSVNALDQTYYTYAEVWGTNSAGQLVAVAWIGGMTDVVTQTGTPGTTQSLPLRLDRAWLQRAAASAPFVLRNVYVQDRYTHVPHSQVAEMKVHTDASVPALHALLAEPYDGQITERMLWGPRPIELHNTTNGDGKLLLVHGYCTKSPGPFPPEQFTDAAVFQDFNANRKIDEFANMVVQFGEQFPSFSVVSHSQGGLVGIHMHSFYWSKLETATGGRLLQSVGSPYQGTSLAGNLAAIGDVLGVGCGTNAEMTRDGAALWLSTLPDSTTPHVNYYTTQYSQSGLIHYCNIAANAVLSWPNDGTTENDYNHLPDATFLGNKKGWCHSTGMHHPPQCTDGDRNREMDAAAAR